MSADQPSSNKWDPGRCQFCRTPFVAAGDSAWKHPSTGKGIGYCLGAAECRNSQETIAERRQVIITKLASKQKFDKVAEVSGIQLSTKGKGAPRAAPIAPSRARLRSRPAARQPSLRSRPRSRSRQYWPSRPQYLKYHSEGCVLGPVVYVGHPAR